jgi:hypothetical protein
MEYKGGKRNPHFMTVGHEIQAQIAPVRKSLDDTAAV